jgi:transcriptional antiterminator NusG
MIMTDESWHVVRNIRGVTGFVGPGSRPTPLTNEEIEALNVEIRTEQLGYDVGDTVSITRGIFAGYSGKLHDISDDKKTVTVLISTASREMPVKLDAADVKAAEK